MKYKDFFSEGYPWGGFDATPRDFAPEKAPNRASDDAGDIAVNGVRVSDSLDEKTVIHNLKNAISEYKRWKKIKKS